MKSLCIGKSEYIFTTTANKFPIEGSKNEVNDVIENIGGSIPVAAYLLAKYGVDSYIASVVGDDTFGNLIRKNLERVGVHTEYMETAYEKRTYIDFNIVNKTSKIPTNFLMNKEKLALKKSEFQMEPDILYIDGNDYGASLASLNKYNNKISVINASNCSQETVELCKYCKYIIATKEFAEWATGQNIDFGNSNSLVTVYSALLNKFVNKEIIITLGEKGALYVSNGQINVMPGLKVEVLNKNGSGDIFKGAFVYALLKGYDIEKAVTFANIAGGLSVSKMGEIESIPELSDVLVYFNQKYGMQSTPSSENNVSSTANTETSNNTNKSTNPEQL